MKIDHQEVSVLTNQDVNDAAPETARRIARLFFSEDVQARERKSHLVRGIFEHLQDGLLDRSLLTAGGNSYFRAGHKGFFQKLGSTRTTCRIHSNRARGAPRNDISILRNTIPAADIDLWVREMPDGKVEQYQLAVKPKPAIP